MFTVISARDPRWADLAHTSIEMWVLFEEFKDTYGEVPFGASPKDPEPHGVDLFNRAVAGEFGPVLEPLEPLEPVVTVDGRVQRDRYAAMATAKIEALNHTLSTLQSTIEAQLKSLPALQAERDAYWLYRVQLAQLDALPGFPVSFDWPVAPATPFV